MSQMPPPPPNAPPPPPGYDYGSGGGPAVTAGKATGALVCGIIGLFACGVILGPVAIYLGTTAKREIEGSGGRLKGTGMATAGIVLGIIAVVVFVISIIVVISV
jgi:Domain of unknown function (DUF4190)